MLAHESMRNLWGRSLLGLTDSDDTVLYQRDHRHRERQKAVGWVDTNGISL